MELATIRALRADPLSLLSNECVLCLGAFLFGYKAADSRLASLFSELRARFDGPSQADPCTRAYLTSSDTLKAFKSVLTEIENLPRNEQEELPLTVQSTNESFVDIVRDPILQKRPAMVLAEPSITWLADFASGYLSGLSVLNPHVAAKQESELRTFENWLREYYGGFHAPWYGLIRIHEGACEQGLLRFIELWDEHAQATK